jgi:hypothetical protein
MGTQRRTTIMPVESKVEPGVTLFTRREYLPINKGEEKLCSYREYWAQFVTESARILLRGYGVDKLIQAYESDENLNNIPLTTWDNLGRNISNRRLRLLMEECGDWVTMAALVCILKEAATQLIEEEKTHA